MTTRPILPTPVVSTDWLAHHLGDPDLRVLDATAHLAGPEPGSTVGWSLRPGLNDYLAAHIPGAAFADIIEDLSQPDGGALSKPSPARFAVAAGRLGIGPASRVVVYALDVHWATRVWWLLRANGFDNAAVLDGGLRKWTAEGQPTTTGLERYPGAEFVGEARPRFFAELDEVKQVVDTGSGACLINSLLAAGPPRRRDQQLRPPRPHPGQPQRVYGRTAQPGRRHLQAGRRAPRDLRRRAVSTGSQGHLLRCRDLGH
jgi:thiosulfate/3-mercaptopyruvate sulfurtransferase